MRLSPIDIGSVRQPEYTGENRCLPCTAVNVVIALVLAATLGIVTTGLLGVVALGGFLAAIYLRGYLVPGTPALTERYLPASILRLFGKEPIATRSLEGTSPEEPWTQLAAAGVADPSPDGTLSLTDRFREAFRVEVGRRESAPGADDVEALAAVSEAVERGPRAYSIDGNRLLRWESDAALVADTASASVLRETVEGWSDLECDDRLALLERIRLLLERCPSCDGPIDRNDERIDPCCQPPHVAVWTVCRDCDAVLADVTAPEADAEAWAGLLGVDTNEPTRTDAPEAVEG
ncbi:hypothetical protein C491_15757 [Natronococcus amylolyticus DSM 10524]|uniref:Uncharacterized protein n=1 Tax=Natronococcus amylolyticus DSM 10524 TaxID=1227497 RepID=L9X0N3_9EURY|nr:hypothetical protein [Natronococcus amylolyticus]ELY55187.1 hypothetical protein C491_15757 [Natronococcus amylolyticus DSM 10524]